MLQVECSTNPEADACYKLNFKITLELMLVTMHIFLYAEADACYKLNIQLTLKLTLVTS